jgi:hypothetical protein
MTDAAPSAKKRKSKDDAHRLLSEKLLEVLAAQRNQGEAAYPLSLRRLAQLAGERASDPQVKAAVTKKPFIEAGYIAKPQKKTKLGQLPAAPVCLLEDLPRLIESDLLLDYCFELACSGKTRMFTPSGLQGELSSTKGVNKQFKQSLDKRIDSGTLPSTIGWLPKGATRFLFRIADIQASIPLVNAADSSCKPTANGDDTQNTANEANSTPDSPPRLPNQTADFAALFEETFTRLDRESGCQNFLKLHALRRALPQFDRQAFDLGLRELRLAGRFALDSSDGNVVSLSTEEREAGIREAGSLLVYCSRR